MINPLIIYSHVLKRPIPNEKKKFQQCFRGIFIIEANHFNRKLQAQMQAPLSLNI